MKILITGYNGQLGYDIGRELKKRGCNHFRGIDKEDLDITDEAAVTAYIKDYKPDVVMHNAAFTAVDRAEEMPEACEKVNVCGTAYIAKAAKEAGAKLVYVSTDYVFDGRAGRPYGVNDAKNPLSVYGRTKSEGEEAVKKYTDRYFIVRTAWVFGVNGNNFVKTMLRLAQQGKTELNVVCDQIGSPTYTHDLAPLLCDMIETEKYGVYHATNENFCSWCEFAAEIFAQAGYRMKVNPVTTEEYGRLVKQQAARPLDSRLDKSVLTAKGFRPLPDWKDALKRYLKELNA